MEKIKEKKAKGKKEKVEDQRNGKVYGIGKYQRAILSIAEKENGRPALEGIKITKDGYAVATDTRMIVKIPLNDYPAEDMPSENDNNITPLKTDTWISTKALEKALKHLPAKTVIPVLGNVFIREDKSKISLITNDLENQVEVKENKEICQENAKNYPKTKEVLMLPGKVKYQITLSISLLKKLVNTLDKMVDSQRSDGVTLFFGENGLHPVHFSFSIGENNRGVAIGVMMPINPGDTPEGNIRVYQKTARKKRQYPGKIKKSREVKKSRK